MKDLKELQTWIQKVSDEIAEKYIKLAKWAMKKIYCTKNKWYYSDGTAIKFVHHEACTLWKSRDGIIRLIDYDDKNEANEMIAKLKNLLYKEKQHEHEL